MKAPKCNDFVIFKVRYYADASLLKNDEIPEQHYERAKIHSKFVWDFIGQVSGKDITSWYLEYMFDARECAFDEIHETHGIHVNKGEGDFTYYIPKQHTEIIEWFKKSSTLPTKLVKKTNVEYLRYYDKVDKTRREESRQRTIEFNKNRNTI